MHFKEYQDSLLEVTIKRNKFWQRQREEMGLHLNLIKIIRILIRVTKCIFQLQPHSGSTNWKSLDDHCPMQLFCDLLRQLSHCCLVKSSSFLLLSSSHLFTHHRSKLNCKICTEHTHLCLAFLVSLTMSAKQEVPRGRTTQYLC